MSLISICSISCGKKTVDEETKPKTKAQVFELSQKSSSEQDLIEATANNDEILVKQALHSGANPNHISVNGKTALGICARYGYIKVAYLLLNNKADPNNFDPTKKSPLIQAVLNNHRFLVKLLVKNKANLDQMDMEGHSALAYALRTKNYLIANTLIQSGARIDHINSKGESALEIARSKKVKKSIALIEDIKKVKESGLSIDHLNFIVENSRVSSFNYMMSKINIDPQLLNSNIIYTATSQKSAYIKDLFIKELIQKGFNIDGSDKDHIPLIRAVNQDDFDTVKLLLKYKINIDKSDNESMSALAYAVKRLSPNMVELLVKNGANKIYSPYSSESRTRLNVCNKIPNTRNFYGRRLVNQETVQKIRRIKKELDC